MNTPFKNKLLLLNSILLVLILAILIILNFNKLNNKIVKNPNENYETIYEDYSDIKYYTRQDSLKADFEGLRNDSKPLPDIVIESITTELSAFNWNDEFQTEDLHNLYHKTVFANQISWDPKVSQRFVVITFSNHGGNFYHAARGMISLFEFRKLNQSWQLTRKYLAFGVGTESGLEPLWCKLVQIGGDSKYAVLVQTNYSGNGGHELETQSIYSEVGCSFELVFDFRNYEHYENSPQEIEYAEGNSNLRFLKSKKAWFDIETKSEETKWNDKTLGAVKRFVFNGNQYVEANRNINVSII